MCGRYVDPAEAAMERFWTIDRRNWRFPELPRFNVPPASEVPIIVRAPDGAIEMLGARWGLIPRWWKKDSLPTLSFNARSEEAAQKPMWRDALRSTRCIMPIRGWFEWNENEQVKTASGRKTNQPYFHYCPDEPVIGVAGLWSIWRAADDTEIITCALLSKEAAPSIAHVHHRMPVILHQDQFGDWLHPDTSPARVQEIIASARGDFSAHRVDTAVNNVRNDGPHLIELLSPPDEFSMFHSDRRDRSDSGHDFQ
ncbi:MAG TPA: SOS response-associated peptidase [Pseudomonadales bacterium]